MSVSQPVVPNVIKPFYLRNICDKGQEPTLEWSPERYFTRVGSGVGWRDLPKDKHSSLLQTFLKYGCNIFITLGAGRQFKTPTWKLILKKNLSNFVNN
jgi:hypothetical protein